MDLITQTSHRPTLPTLVTEEELVIQQPSIEMVVSPEPALHPAEDERDDPLRIFVFDTQRTSAQMFSRQLLSHLRCGSIDNPYALAATLGPERIQPRLHNNERVQQAWEDQVSKAPPTVTSVTYQAATERFLRHADRLEANGKTLFIREQAPLVMRHDIVVSSLRDPEFPISRLENPTCLPDELLNLITPIIFIRHPARVIPAWYREANSRTDLYNIDNDDDVDLWTSARWTRMIFDHLRATRRSKRPSSSEKQRVDSVLSTSSGKSSGLPIVSKGPIVIDAADVLHNTHAILATLCRLLDLNVAGVQDTWSPTAQLERAYGYLTKTISENLLKAFSDRLKGFSTSTHETPDPNSEYALSLDHEHEQWTAEFGPATAHAIRRKVEADLPHYEYLKIFKLRVRPSRTEISFKENVFGIPLELRQTIDGPTSMIWTEGEKVRIAELGEKKGGGAAGRRRASLGRVPVGLY